MEFSELTEAQQKRICLLAAVLADHKQHRKARGTLAALAYHTQLDYGTLDLMTGYLDKRHKRLIYASQLLVHQTEPWFQAYLNARPFVAAQVAVSYQAWLRTLSENDNAQDDDNSAAGADSPVP